MNKAVSKYSSSACSRERLLPAVPGVVHVLGVPNCFAPNNRYSGTVAPFRSLLDIKKDVCALAKVPQWWSRGGKLYHNGVQIPITSWGKIYTAPGDHVEFVAMPGGKVGNMLLKVVGAIMQVVGAMLVFTPFAPVGYGLMAAGAALTLAADFICPIKPPSLGNTGDDKAASPTYSLNGSSNAMGYDQPIPRLYGRFKVPPRRILDDYTELSGNDEYLNFLAVVGYGPLQMTDWKIGGTAIGNYNGVSMQVCQGWAANEMPTLCTKVAFQTSLQALLASRDSSGNVIGDREQWWVRRSIDHEVNKISFDISAPQGVYHLNDKAEKFRDTMYIEYQYCEAGTNNWISGDVTIPDATISFDEGWSSRRNTKYVYLLNDTIQMGESNAGDLLMTRSYELQYRREGRETYSEYVANTSYNNTNLTKYHITVTQQSGTGYRFTGGWYRKSALSVALTGNGANPSTAVRKTVSIDVSRYGLKKWDIRVRRRDVESTDSKYVSTVYLTAVRGINTKEKLYSGDKPLASIAMRIKATNQLSNSLGAVTCIATSILPDWDKASKKWVQRATRNPASIFLDILRGSANERAKLDSQIDFDSIQKWHEWCAQYGYTCDIMMDTQRNVWDALCEVAVAGRGSPSLIGGKWGVVWAHKQTEVRGHVTVRNASNFSSARTYMSELHGLTVTFNDEDEDYEENQITVYAPGRNKSNSSLFENIQLTGVTNKTLAAYTGQFRLNQILLMGEEYSCTMPLEYMRLQKNDLVRVVRPEVMYGIGAAWVKSCETNADGALTAVILDAQLDMTNGQQYMGVVRLGDGSELSFTGIAFNGKKITLSSPMYVNDLPRERDLIMVGTYQQVGRLCIVTSIKPKEKLQATVTFQDYIDAMYENDGGVVPPYDPCITLPGILRLAAAEPTIETVRSDEWALATNGTELFPRIYVSWRFNDDSTCARVEYRRKVNGVVNNGIIDDEDVDTIPSNTVGEDGWIVLGSFTNERHCYIEDVDEGYTVNAAQQTVDRNGITYDIRVQAVHLTKGITSSWVESSGHAVVGRTSFPAQVSNLALAIKNPEGIEATWTQLDSKDIAKYALYGSVSGESATGYAILKPYNVSGLITENIVAQDVMGLRSKAVGTASVRVIPPAAPNPEYFVSKTGAVITWPDCSGSWDIDHYIVEDEYAGTSREYSDPMFQISPRPLGVNYKFHITAVDIFKNLGTSKDYGITIQPMQAPKPSAKVDGGQVVVSWAFVDSPFEIDHYEVRELSGKASGSVKGNVFRFEVVSIDKFGNVISLPSAEYDFQVRAVDIAGNASPWGECELSIAKPKAPKNLTVEVVEDQLVLNWQETVSDLPILSYDVVRLYENTRQDGITETEEEDYGRLDVIQTYVPAVKVGLHSFMVRAVDASGNISEWCAQDFEVLAPGKVTYYNSGATINNVMLYYTDPDRIFFPIKEYAVYDVDEDGFEAEIGRTDTHFFAEVQDVGGNYTYRIYPVDCADNIGAPSDITVKVEDPAGLIVYHDFDSLFNGTRVNMHLDGKGNMIGPMNMSLKWSDTGKSWAAKIAEGNTSWVSPGVTLGTYTETVSVNMDIPSSYVGVTVTSKTLQGSPKIHVFQTASSDGVTWSDEQEGEKCKFDAFSYIRFRIEVTDGIVAISNIHVSIEVLQLEDLGVSNVYAADCYDEDGNFVVGNRIGTWIPFAISFYDVNTPISIAAVDQSTGMNPFAVFEDTANPTGFRAILLDKTGTPIDGKVKWSITGV